MKELLIKLTQAEVELLLEAVSKLPLEKSMNVFLNLRGQAQEQLFPKETQGVNTDK